jgi:hypothetical protein
MDHGKLVWIGLVCCIAALMTQVFPQAAYQLGVDIAAGWRLFGFGLFLIAIAALMTAAGAAGNRCRCE